MAGVNTGRADDAIRRRHRMRRESVEIVWGEVATALLVIAIMVFLLLV
jgi:hypothetical protein